MAKFADPTGIFYNRQSKNRQLTGIFNFLFARNLVQPRISTGRGCEPRHPSSGTERQFYIERATAFTKIYITVSASLHVFFQIGPIIANRQTWKGIYQ